MNYKEKYIKYKIKYLELKTVEQSGGGSVEDFLKASKKIPHKWKKIKQLDDYDINNFLEIKLKKLKNSKYKITVINKDIHPEYKLKEISFYVDKDELLYVDGEKNKIKKRGFLFPVSKKKHIVTIDTENSPYLKIDALVISEDEGLLDIGLQTKIELENEKSIKKKKKKTKKKKNRPSPSDSATKFKLGTKKKGNDGNMWIIVENKNGVKRWSKNK